MHDVFSLANFFLVRALSAQFLTMIFMLPRLYGPR